MRCPGVPEDDYAFYALGNLEDEEARQIDEHLRDRCETCTTEVARARGIWYAVAAATPEAKPSRDLRARLLDSIAPAPKARTGWWNSWVPVMSGAGAVALAVTVVGLVLLQRLPAPSLTFSPVYPAPLIVTSNRVVEVPAPATVPPAQVAEDPARAQALAALNAELTREKERTAQLTAELARQQPPPRPAENTAAAPLVRNAALEETQQRLAAATARAADLERQVSQYRTLLEIERRRADQTTQVASLLSEPSLRVIRLRGTEKGQSAEGHALLAEGSQMVFYGTRLPALPANRTYQLWLVRSAGPAIASAGTFNPDAANRATLQFRNAALLSGVTALAITDEPAGGSAQPTGHKWMIGS